MPQDSGDELIAERRQAQAALILGRIAGEQIGAAGDIAASLGLPPPITSDQVELLRRDTVVSPGALGLADLGIGATPLEPVISTYLYRFRDGGQYAESPPPAGAPV